MTTPAPGTPQTSTKAQIAGLGSAVTAFCVGLAALIPDNETLQLILSIIVLLAGSAATAYAAYTVPNTAVRPVDSSEV